MKKRIKNAIGYILAFILMGEYTFGMMKGYCTDNKVMMIITTIAWMICMVLLSRYIDEEA